MRRLLIPLFAALLLAGAGSLLILAYEHGREELEEEDEAPIGKPVSIDRTPDNEVLIRLPADAQAAIGIQTAPLAESRLAPEVVGYGRLVLDPSLSFTVRAAISGRLQADRSLEWPGIGVQLAQGMRLGHIEPRLAAMDRIDLADRLANARATLDQTAASLQAARQALERSHQLNREQEVVPQQALEEQAAEVKQLEARHRGAEREIEILRSALDGKGDPVSNEPVRVEQPGEVTEVLARPGENVEAGQPLLVTARFDPIHARISLPAGIVLNPMPDKARCVVSGSDSTVLTGRRVAAAGDRSQPPGGQAFIYRIDAGSVPLRPGLPVTAYLSLPGSSRSGVIVPRDAVVRYAGARWVYRQVTDGEYARRRIVPDSPVEQGWFVTSDLKPGDRVVVVGAQMLLSEELKTLIEVGEE